MIYKVSEYNIVDVKDAFKLWADWYIEDERQTLLPTNQFKFKGLSTENVHKKLKEVFKGKAVRISELKYKGGEIAKFYEKKDYQKILDHLASDINFLRDLHY
ncbi:MAG: hypothetical protein QME47_07785, partial [Candidatus Thermoplasmatota archaeon]|nr:hypothetical protein [Candidatus Thermoplasmatota archaeon]